MRRKRSIDGRQSKVDRHQSSHEGRKWGRALKIIQSFVICTMVVGAISSARADDADLAQVLRTLKALESRVESLESEKQQYRRLAADLGRP
jgi:tetrahydromethanopterin S-methyltransferase subunit G